MGLRLEDKWIWDFWLAEDDGAFHLFYLQAPRSLADPDLRHVHASVGHAVSSDLSAWTVLDDALRSGPPGSWDELATWTGSVIKKYDLWYMLYTGAQRSGDRLVQQIGGAISPDLLTWTKLPAPLFRAEQRWYETLADGVWFEEAWRDPWVFAGDDGSFHALVTARAKEGPLNGRGVVGHAASHDLLSWEVMPPLSEPGEFGHLEVIQLVGIEGSNFLVFSSDGRMVSRARRARLGLEPRDATYIVPAPGPLGPFDVSSAEPALPAHLYSGRLVQTRDGSWAWLAFLHRDDDGGFVGELSDPIPFSGWSVL